MDRDVLKMANSSENRKITDAFAFQPCYLEDSGLQSKTSNFQTSLSCNDTTPRLSRQYLHSQQRAVYCLGREKPGYCYVVNPCQLMPLSYGTIRQRDIPVCRAGSVCLRGGLASLPCLQPAACLLHREALHHISRHLLSSPGWLLRPHLWWERVSIALLFLGVRWTTVWGEKKI